MEQAYCPASFGEGLEFELAGCLPWKLVARRSFGVCCWHDGGNILRAVMASWTFGCSAAMVASCDVWCGVVGGAFAARRGVFRRWSVGAVVVL